MTKKEATEYALHYIINTEYEDFKEWLSEGHVYFLAVHALFGRNAAKRELREVREEMEGES
jgi:uncharacterized HAD superfamily protein